MRDEEFGGIFESYMRAGVDGKINIYCTAQGLTQEQYTTLLRSFPLDKLSRLEEALG